MATRSPGSTPRATSASASRVTSCESSAYDSSTRAPSSPSHTTAGRSGASRFQRCTHASATFSRPPTNQVAHSAPRERSTTRSHGCENSIPRSSTTAGQNHSGSSWERCWNAVKSSNPCRRMKRTTFARSSTSSLGSQTTSGTAEPYSAASSGEVRALINDPDKRKWFTLGAVSFGLFMIMLDNTVVNVALPAIQRDLGVGISELERIVAGYALTFAAFMLPGGKLADYYGRRLIFVLGIVIFTGASLACGLADSGNVLIGARIAQGVGAALMNPAMLSIISATFAPRQRGMAIGIWAGVSALALAIGPLVGGLLTEHVSWNWIFFVNVPIGIFAIAASFAFIDESRDTRAQQRLDLPGLATVALGLFALTYGLIEANTYGWTSARILGAFAIAVVMLAAFVLIERHGRAPMLDLSLFRNLTYTGANIVMLLVALAMFGIFFFLSLYMQNILGYSAVQTGAAFLPWTILIVLVAPVTG